MSDSAHKHSQSRPQPNAGIMKIAAYVGGDGSIPGVENPIRLASNECLLGPSPNAVAAYRAVAEKGLHWYPDSGHGRFRQVLAERHGIEADRIVCSNGSDELISLLTKAYAGPGDEVVFSEHGFAMYPIATMTAGATPVVVKDDGLGADVDAFIAAVTDKTRMVFLANPNNPTGSLLPATEVARLHAGLPDHVLLVLDAAYAEYVSRNDYESGIELVRKHDNVVTTRTFSKAYGMAGVRLGWCYAPDHVVAVLQRVRGPFNVNAAALAAGEAAVLDIAHLDQARAMNDMVLPWFSEQVRGLGLDVPPSAGNFVLVRFANKDGQTADAANDHLIADGIIPRKVAAYGLADCLRITIGPEAAMQKVVASLVRFTAAH